jgi:hypothetical protein
MAQRECITCVCMSSAKPVRLRQDVAGWVEALLVKRARGRCGFAKNASHLCLAHAQQRMPLGAGAQL